jgi:putative transposase
VKYQSGGVQALLLGYQGSESYLTQEQRTESVKWISAHESISVEAVRDYIEDNYGVVYRSKQSYYEMMQEAGLSYHKSEKTNPKRDEEQVLGRREEIKKKWSNITKR